MSKIIDNQFFGCSPKSIEGKQHSLCNVFNFRSKRIFVKKNSVCENEQKITKTDGNTDVTAILFLSPYQEHFLSNGSHLDKDDFLSQMALYSNASSTYLESVSAAFFAKVLPLSSRITSRAYCCLCSKIHMWV